MALSEAQARGRTYSPRSATDDLLADVVDATTLKIGGVDKTEILAAALANPVVGVASGYKVARGEAAVTGTADVVSGLATVVQAVACLEADPVVGEAMWVSVADHATPGTFTIKTWKPTAVDNATPVAGTGTPSVRWIAIGT